MVIRSGDVIPKITEIVDKGVNELSLPTNCPSCDSDLKRDGVNLVCTGTNCRDRDIQVIRHWIRITDIEGLGPKNVAKLYDQGLIRHFADLYDKKLTESELVNLLGKNGSKIFRSIQEKRHIPFHIFLAGLGIESLGKGMAKTLAKHYKSFEDLKKTSIKQLITLEGISDLTANYIHSGLQDPSLSQLFAKGIKIIYKDERKSLMKKRRKGGLDLFIASNEVNESSSENQEPVKTIYITGKISGMTKTELRNFIAQYNYEWASLTKKLDLLVLGENPGSAKIEKARKYGIPIKPWDDFMKELS
jgi:DNA ligase (NAD+)